MYLLCSRFKKINLGLLEAIKGEPNSVRGRLARFHQHEIENMQFNKELIREIRHLISIISEICR